MATVSQITADPALETHLFWDQYKTTIIAVVAVLVLAAVAFFGYQMYRAHQTSQAASLLASAKTPQQYQEVITRYPGSNPAASAYLLLAAEMRMKKKHAEANSALHEFVARYPKHSLITTAWMGIAANLDSLGKTDEALSTYQRLATEYPQSYNAPLALLAQVPLLKAKKRFEDARRICETVLSQHSGSVVASQAMQELISLPKPPAQAVPAQPAPSQIPMERPPEPTAVPAAKP